MKTTSEGQNDQTHPATRTATDMTDENTAPNQPKPLPAAIIEKWGIDQPEFFGPFLGHYNQQSGWKKRAAKGDLSDNSKLEDKYRNFEFRRRFEKIQFQVRCEFELAAAEIARELQRSKPLADALSQPGPCDGDLHSKIMPWKGSER
jgi:hypothetical protein